MKKPAYTTPKNFEFFSKNSFEETFGISIEELIKHKPDYHFVFDGCKIHDLSWVDELIETNQLEDCVGCLETVYDIESVTEYGTVIDIDFTNPRTHLFFLKKKIINFI